MEQDRIIQVAIYARVSSEQQCQAGTIDSQLAALRIRVREDGFEVRAEMSFVDDGYSGATLVRPGLERLRDLAALGGVDRVYVHSPDRLSRRYAYQVLLLDEFRQYGVSVIFLNHPVGRTAEDELLLQVQGMISEYERAKITERGRRGKLHAARRGLVNALSSTPYGYRYIRRDATAGGAAAFEIALAEAGVVRRIFEWVGQERVSIGEVCRRLAGEGIASPTGKSYWRRSMIWAMLKNPAYQGQAGFGKTRRVPRETPLRPARGRSEIPRRQTTTHGVPNGEWIYIPVPALVSSDLWASVQDRLAENQKRYRRGDSGIRHLLQGLTVCKRCGYTYYRTGMHLRTDHGTAYEYAYYRCAGSDRHRFGGQRICSNPMVRMDALEDAVWRDVCGLLANPRRIEDEYRRRETHSQSDSEWNSVEQMDKLMAKIKRGLARLVDAYQDGWLEKSDFETRMKRTRDRMEMLQKERNTMLEEQSREREWRLAMAGVETFAHQVKEGLEKADWETRRKVICALVKRVEMDEKTIRIVYKINPLPSDSAATFLQDCPRREEHKVNFSKIKRRPLTPR
jgi:site-specific DNA recombinase